MNSIEQEILKKEEENNFLRNKLIVMNDLCKKIFGMDLEQLEKESELAHSQNDPSSQPIREVLIK
jgi:hypothetical protein